MTATIQDNWVVSIDYTLRLSNGEVIDTSEGREPLQYIQGQGQIIPGLEDAIVGMQVGDEKDVIVAPAEGYGKEEPDLKETLPRSAFPQELELGDAFRMRTETGHTVVVYVEEVDAENVLVNLNHPLAGETLHFHVKIVDAREASDDDLLDCGDCDGCSGCSEQSCDHCH